jgi:multidrug efflux pump subunit AcrB
VHFLLSVDPDMMGGFYVNDFNVFGHTWQVNVQAETTYRKSVDDIYRTYVRNAKGGMVPIRAVAQARLVQGPQAMVRYNGYRAAIINGAAKPGYSSGQALEAMRRVVGDDTAAGLQLRVDRHGAVPMLYVVFHWLREQVNRGAAPRPAEAPTGD